jgi:hypothetical protein
MLGQDARDVIVHDNDFISEFGKLLRENPDGC